MNILGKRVGVERRPFWKRKDASVRDTWLDQKGNNEKPVSEATEVTEVSDTPMIIEKTRSKIGDERLSEPATSLSAPIPIPTPSPLLSPLSALVSQFIVDNVRSTHDSIQDETERRKFILDLRDSLKSVRSGKKLPARRSISKVVHVIDFFAETTESTMLSIENEEERINFEDHLKGELFQNFDCDDTVVLIAKTNR